MAGSGAKVLSDGMDQGRFRKPDQSGTYRVVAGGYSYPVVRLTNAGFALSAQDAPKLRGVVELYRDREYVLMGLVMANAPEDGEIFYDFKRATPVTDRPPLDFVMRLDDGLDASAQDLGVY